MTTANKVLMQQARESLRGKWGVAIGGYTLYGVILTIPSVFKRLGSIITLFIGGPIVYGMSKFSLSISRNQEVHISEMFSGFRTDLYWRLFKAYFLKMLFVILWLLLLIVPGVIAALAYSQTFYILADDPLISASDALKKSKKMMDGYKWKLVCLDGRFLGWGILSILTFGIGLLWLIPYVQVSSAKFYDDLVRVANEDVKVEEKVIVIPEVMPVV